MTAPVAIAIPPARRFYTDGEIGQICGVHRSWVWRQMKRDRTFPRPIKLSRGVTRWKADEIDAWLESLESKEHKA